MHCVDEGGVDGSALVEVARAHDRLEATVWARNLEDLGIEVTTENKGNLLLTLLYLGRTPIAVKVPARDHARALEYLKRYRFI